MPIALISGLVQGGATALLLGVILWRLAPSLIRTFERLHKAQRLELREVREAHEADVRRLTDALERVARAQRVAEARQELRHAALLGELRIQTREVIGLRRDWSGDISIPPPVELPALPPTTQDVPGDVEKETDR